MGGGRHNNGADNFGQINANKISLARQVFEGDFVMKRKQGSPLPIAKWLIGDST
jgi:hypothetical protein